MPGIVPTSSAFPGLIFKTGHYHDSQRVIYPWQAKLGMLCTNNEDAYLELGFDFSDGIDWSKMMFCAMEQDVQSYIGDVDFDD